MTNTINKVLQIYKDDIPFTFNIRKTNYNVRYEELLYLQNRYYTHYIRKLKKHCRIKIMLKL